MIATHFFKSVFHWATSCLFSENLYIKGQNLIFYVLPFAKGIINEAPTTPDACCVTEGHSLWTNNNFAIQRQKVQAKNTIYCKLIKWNTTTMYSYYFILYFRLLATNKTTYGTPSCFNQKNKTKNMALVEQQQLMSFIKKATTVCFYGFTGIGQS